MPSLNTCVAELCVVRVWSHAVVLVPYVIVFGYVNM